MNVSLSPMRLLAMLGLFLFADGQGLLLAQTTWRRTYGGFGADEARSVRQTSDGGYILFGSTGSFGFGGGDMYLLRLDADGTPLWSRTYLDGFVQTGMACREVADGFIFVGSTNGMIGYDVLLLKVGFGGEVVWQKQFGSANWDLASDLEVLTDGLVIVGTTYGSGSGTGDAYVLRTDEQGDLLWTATLGGFGEDQGMGAGVANDGGVFVTGIEGVGGSDQNGFITKLTPTGAVEWNRIIGGDSLDYVYDAVETVSGDIVFSGGSRSYSTVWQVLVGKLNSAGDSLWQNAFGSVGDSKGYEVSLTSTGGHAQAVYNSAFNAGGRDMFLLLTDVDGIFLLGKNYGGLGDEEGYSLQATSDGGYIVAGMTETYGPGLRAMYVVKSNAIGETLDDTVYEMFDPLTTNDLTSESTSLLTLIPSPSSGPLTVRAKEELQDLSISDMTGRQLLSRAVQGLEVGLDLELPSGTYVLSATTQQGHILRQVFILQRP